MLETLALSFLFFYLASCTKYCTTNLFGNSCKLYFVHPILNSNYEIEKLDNELLNLIYMFSTMERNFAFMIQRPIYGKKTLIALDF